MTAHDLIEILEGVDPHTEVLLAEQPSWPFEYSIREAALVNIGAPDEGDRAVWIDQDGTEREGAVVEVYGDGMIEVAFEDADGQTITDRVTLEALGKESRTVVYLAEGSQLGYLPGVVGREFGWR